MSSHPLDHIYTLFLSHSECSISPWLHGSNLLALSNLWASSISSLTLGISFEMSFNSCFLASIATHGQELLSFNCRFLVQAGSFSSLLGLYLREGGFDTKRLDTMPTTILLKESKKNRSQDFHAGTVKAIIGGTGRGRAWLIG